jgi:hypothetical protein
VSGIHLGEELLHRHRRVRAEPKVPPFLSIARGEFLKVPELI